LYCIFCQDKLLLPTWKYMQARLNKAKLFGAMAVFFER